MLYPFSTPDEAQIDEQARLYRRASIQNYPVRSRGDLSKVAAGSKDVKKVRTLVPDDDNDHDGDETHEFKEQNRNSRPGMTDDKKILLIFGPF